VTGPVHLANGIAMNSATQNAARIVGPSLIAVLGGPFGMGAVFLLNGACLLTAAAVLLPIEARGLALERPRASVLAEVREGVLYSLRAPTIFLTLSLLAAISTFVFNFQIFVPTLVREVLGEGTATYGLLMAALGVGSLAGSLGLAVFARGRPSLALLIGTALTVSALTAGMSATGQLLPAAVLLVAIGLMQALFQSSALTTVQLATPPALTGRVLSLYSLLQLGVTPIGYSFTGFITEHLGVPSGFLVGGTVSLALCAAAVGWWSIRRAQGWRAIDPDRVPAATTLTLDAEEQLAAPGGVEQRA
jgi:predicted MFS family arabinose efflux permease